ncbi:MAG: class I SAM-dependent methyltransferase, partial [Owenweeksia sp.]
MTKTEYNKIAGEYKESKLLGFRKHIEAHTLFELMGNLKGKKVLDLACGEGIYTRKIKMAGAEKAVGVDLSSEMIRLAETEENRNPLGCSYLVSDVAQLGPVDEFDIVVGSYLLNYSTTKEELAAFAQSIYNNLKPGGHFIGFNNNPADFTHSDTRYRSYGFT